MMRLLGALLGLLLLAAVAAGGAAAWLLSTDGGARWLAGQLNQRVAGVELSGVSGNLLSGLRVDRFVYLGVLHVHLREVELEAALWPLLELQAIDVLRFRAAAVELALPVADADEQAQAPLQLAQLALPSLPLPLRVRAAQVKLLQFEGVALEDLAIAGAWREEGLFIDELRVRQGEVSLDARGTLGARAPLQLDVALTWFHADMSGRAGVTGPLSQPRITHRWTNPWVTPVTSQGRLNLQEWPRVGADLNHSIDDPRVRLNTILEGADRDWQILADGRVMDYPVQGQIRAGLHEVITLDVEQGRVAEQVRFALQLAYGQTLEVDAQLASDELAALVADIAGDARVQLNYRDGHIELAAQSRRLLAGGAELTDTRIEAAGPVQWREGRIAVTALSQRLRVADAELAEVNLSLQGPIENLRFGARWAQGHLSGSLQPLGERIEVAVDAGAEINAEGYTFTNLDAFTVAGRGTLWTASPHCWAGLGEVCIEQSELAADVAAASGRISGLQLAAFNSLLPVAFDHATRLSGDWRWRSETGEWLATTQLETQELNFTAQERQFDWLPDVALRAEVSPSGIVLDASGAQSGLNWLATLEADGWTAAANIKGHAEVDLDAATLPELVDALRRFEGAVSAKVDLSGTLGAPLAAAAGTWRQGTFDWRDPALILTDINMDWQADPSGWSIQGRALSEQGGALTLHGSGDGYDTRAAMQGNVASEGLTLRSDLWTVSAVPEAQVVVRDGRVRFDGSAEVPSARVFIKSLPTALPKPVADVRVRGRPEMVVDDAALPVRGRLKIILGDDVRLELLSLAVRLTGDVVAEVEGMEVAALHGELVVADGSLNASGQSLKVKDGRILFSGDPELPYVDLIATREIRDQTPPLEVGLRISGRADALKTTLYSVPAMNETRQLSFLVLGRDFNEASDADSNRLLSAAISLGLSQSRGVVEQLRGALGLDELAALAAEQNDVAIVAGKRITEDLYVRYSYNALSAVSALIIRYHLTDRWRLEATNDVNSSMDLLYEFSR